MMERSALPQAADSLYGVKRRALRSSLLSELVATLLVTLLVYCAYAWLRNGLTPAAALLQLLEELQPRRVFAPFFAPHPALTTLLILVGAGIGVSEILSRRVQRWVLGERRGQLALGVLRHQQTFDGMADVMQMLAKRDRSRSELLAGLSHDLLKPVACIRGYLETIMLQKDELTPETKERYMNAALKNSEKLDRMVAECLELSKLECREATPALEPFPVHDLVSDVYAKYLPRAAERGVHLEVSGDDSVPSVRADVGMIERAISNLVDNAVSYTPAGGTVRISCFRYQGRVVLMVQDDGIGIAAEELPKIFEPMYRAKKGEFPDPGGSGLGLPICLRILRAHGTTLYVESAPGAGTTMAFELETDRV